jgi:hypothetical protein
MVKFTAFICQLLKKPTSYSYIAYTQSSGSVPQKNPVEVTLASCPKSTIKSTEENYQSILDECFNNQSSVDEFPIHV